MEHFYILHEQETLFIKISFWSKWETSYSKEITSATITLANLKIKENNDKMLQKELQTVALLLFSALNAHFWILYYLQYLHIPWQSTTGKENKIEKGKNVFSVHFYMSIADSDTLFAAL